MELSLIASHTVLQLFFNTVANFVKVRMLLKLVAVQTFCRIELKTLLNEINCVSSKIRVLHF